MPSKPTHDPYAMDVDLLSKAIQNLQAYPSFEEEEEDDEDLQETEEALSDLDELINNRAKELVYEALDAILTKEQKRDLKAKKCFFCHQPGH